MSINPPVYRPRAGFLQEVSLCSQKLESFCDFVRFGRLAVMLLQQPVTLTEKTFLKLKVTARV